MQIHLSGHHVEITDGIREAVNNKFSKVESHYPNVNTMTVVVTVERHEQRIEASTHFLGATVAVQSCNNDLYVAIADASKKMDSALSHRKGSTHSHRNEKVNLNTEA